MREGVLLALVYERDSVLLPGRVDAETLETYLYTYVCVCVCVCVCMCECVCVWEGDVNVYWPGRTVHNAHATCQDTPCYQGTSENPASSQPQGHDRGVFWVHSVTVQQTRGPTPPPQRTWGPPRYCGSLGTSPQHVDTAQRRQSDEDHDLQKRGR